MYSYLYRDIHKYMYIYIYIYIFLDVLIITLYIVFNINRSCVHVSVILFYYISTRPQYDYTYR